MQEQARAPAALFLPFPEPGQRPQLSTADTRTYTTHAHTRPTHTHDPHNVSTWVTCTQDAATPNTRRQHASMQHSSRGPHASHCHTVAVHSRLHGPQSCARSLTPRSPSAHYGHMEWGNTAHTQTHRHTHTHGLQGQPTASPVQQVQPTSLRGREAPPHYSGEVSVSICFVHPPGGEHLENSSGFYP